MYCFENFHKGTFALFHSCPVPQRQPDYYTHSGSTYWDAGDRVIRWSTHWGRNIRSCVWMLDGKQFNSPTECRAGWCLYQDFNPAEHYREWLYGSLTERENDGNDSSESIQYRGTE